MRTGAVWLRLRGGKAGGPGAGEAGVGGLVGGHGMAGAVLHWCAFWSLLHDPTTPHPHPGKAHCFLEFGTCCLQGVPVAHAWPCYWHMAGRPTMFSKHLLHLPFPV